MSLNNPDELERKLRDAGAEYTQVDFQKELDEANNRLDISVGRQFVERKVIEFEDQSLVDLEFSSLESFDKVYNRSDDSIVDSSNYTVDLANGQVDFDSSYKDDNFFEGLVLRFYYIPTAFKTLELYFALQQVVELETVITSDDVQALKADRIDKRIQSTIRSINSRNSVAVQHGDNNNRGSAAPGRFKD